MYFFLAFCYKGAMALACAPGLGQGKGHEASSKQQPLQQPWFKKIRASVPILRYALKIKACVVVRNAFCGDHSSFSKIFRFVTLSVFGGVRIDKTGKKDEMMRLITKSYSKVFF